MINYFERMNHSVTTDDRFVVSMIAGMIYQYIDGGDSDTKMGAFLQDGESFVTNFIARNLPHAWFDAIDGIGPARLALIEDLVRVLINEPPVNEDVDVYNMTY